MMLLSCIIITLYIIFIICKYKCIPISISSTYYMSGKTIWFSLITFLTSVLMLYPLFEVTHERYEFLVFFGCMGVIFSAAAPNFDEVFEKYIHYIGAIISGVATQVWCHIHNDFTIFIWLMMGLFYITTSNKNYKHMFWTEILCFINIYLTYFYYI